MLLEFMLLHANLLSRSLHFSFRRAIFRWLSPFIFPWLSTCHVYFLSLVRLAIDSFYLVDARLVLANGDFPLLVCRLFSIGRDIGGISLVEMLTHPL